MIVIRARMWLTTWGHVRLVLAMLICQVAQGVEVRDLLDRAAHIDGAAYWAIASGPQWTPDSIKDLGTLVKQEPRQWLARAWYARMQVPAAAALSERVQVLLQTSGAPVTALLDATVVGPHTWASRKADMAMREALVGVTMSISDHLAVVMEALIHPRQPASAVAKFHLMRHVMYYEPFGSSGINNVRMMGSFNGKNAEPEEVTLLHELRAGCLMNAPPEVGIPLASAVLDDVGKRYLETQANRSGVSAALAGLYRGAQLREDRGMFGPRVLMDGIWFDAWLSHVDPATVTALAEILCPAPAVVVEVPNHQRFLVSWGPTERVDPNAFGPVLRLHEAAIDPAVVRRYQAQVEVDGADVMEMLVYPDFFDAEDGSLSGSILDQIDALLAAPLPQTADKIQALPIKDPHGIRFRDELVTRLRTGRKARYPSGVELQHFQEFLYPIKVLPEEP